MRLLQKDSQSFLVATLSGILRPDAEMIQKTESLLREKLEEPDLNLVIMFLKPDLYDREGHLRLELIGFVASRLTRRRL